MKDRVARKSGLVSRDILSRAVFEKLLSPFVIFDMNEHYQPVMSSRENSRRILAGTVAFPAKGPVLSRKAAKPKDLLIDQALQSESGNHGA